MPLLGVLLIMLALWASAFPAISASLKHYTPGHVALGRYLVASLVLVVVAVLQRWPMPDKRDLPALALMGLLGFTIYNITLNFGQKVTPAGVASFLVNVAPVFVVIFAATFLREKVRPAGWIGIFISLCGMALLAQAKGGGLRLNPGAILIVLAALSAAGYNILQKRYLRKYGPVHLVAYCIWCGTFFMLVFAPGLLDELRNAPPSATLTIIYMGVFRPLLRTLCGVTCCRASRFPLRSASFTWCLCWQLSCRTSGWVKCSPHVRCWAAFLRCWVSSW
jgi:drug/metabolite transporter (DMT)-like permease